MSLGELRIRGIWAMGKGMGRAEVVLFYNVDEKTVLEWINRFNSRGIDSLADLPRCGAPRRIAKEEMTEEIIPILDDPNSVGEEHWTAMKLRGYLEREFSVEVSYPYWFGIFMSLTDTRGCQVLCRNLLVVIPGMISAPLLPIR